MKNILFLSFLLVCLLQSCTNEPELCPGFFLLDGTIQGTDEYMIVEAIIDDQYSGRFVHVSQKTHSNSDSSSLAVYFDSEQIQFSEEGIANYISLNSVDFIWGDLFSTETNLISDEELQCIFDSSANGFGAYNEKYPDSRAYLSIGRPLIEGDQAIVTYIYHCGGLCSSGWTVTLEKQLEEWEVVKQHIIWIS